MKSVINNLSDRGNEIQYDSTDLLYGKGEIVLSSYNLVNGIVTIEGYKTINGNNIYFSMEGTISKSNYSNKFIALL